MHAVVIGSGPGGINASLTLSPNAKVTVVEASERLGGTCVLYGCIPSKAMLHAGHLSAEVLQLGKELKFHQNDQLKLGMDAINRMSKGVEYTLESHGINVIRGKASLRSGKVAVNGQTIEADAIVVATGSEKPTGENLIASDDIPYLKSEVKVAVVIGGGAGGVEYAELLRSWGAEVHVIEVSDKLLNGADEELRQAVTRNFQRKGIILHLGRTAERVEPGRVVLDDGTAIKTDITLKSFGRKVASAGFEELSPSPFIKVDSRMYTGIGNIYAVGDVTGSYTAHEAMHGGVIAGLNILGMERVFRREYVPKVIYTHPEIANVGKRTGKSVKVNYVQNARAITEKETEGFLKLFYDGGRINGAVAYGERAEEIVTLIGFAMQNDISLQSLFDFTFPHPSYMELIWDAVAMALGHIKS